MSNIHEILGSIDAKLDKWGTSAEALEAQLALTKEKAAERFEGQNKRVNEFALFLLAFFLASATLQGVSSAFQYGHYFPGVVGIRDFVTPPPGFYYAQYNIFYTTDRVNDRNGNKLPSSITLPGGGTVSQEGRLNIFAIAPTFAWVAEKKILGGSYGAAISPWFGNTTLGAQVNAFGLVRDVSSSEWGLGDIFVQPVMLGWHWDHFDLSTGYGFWAPTGADNLTLRTWTNQFQLSGYWYPWKHKATALQLTTTYELHSEAIDRDFGLGDNLSLEYGLSQYLTERFSLGITGYSNLQITENSGRLVLFPGVLSQHHAIGGEVTYFAVPMKLYFSFNYKYEYLAKSRFQGQLSNLTFTWIF